MAVNWADGMHGLSPTRSSPLASIRRAMAPAPRPLFPPSLPPSFRVRKVHGDQVKQAIHRRCAWLNSGNHAASIPHHCKHSDGRPHNSISGRASQLSEPQHSQAPKQGKSRASLWLQRIALGLRINDHAETDVEDLLPSIVTPAAGAAAELGTIAPRTAADDFPVVRAVRRA